MYYRQQLEEFPEITLNPIQIDCSSGAWMPNVLFSSESGVDRDSLLLGFDAANIDARVFFWPLSDLGLYPLRNNPIAREVSSHAINLPSYHDMTTDDQDRVINVLKEILLIERMRRGTS